MAAKEDKIEVFPREEVGKRGLRKLRGDGFVPGIFYGPGLDVSYMFKVDEKELRRALQSEALIHHVNMDGKRRNVLVKAIQFHPVTEDIIHVDLQSVRMDETVEIRVPIHLLGRPIGVKDEGGQIHQSLLEIELRCLASEIPSHLEIDISELHIGQAIHAEELDVGSAELVTTPDAVVISVARARGVAEEEVEVEEVEEEFLFEEGEEGEPPPEKPEEEPSGEE